MTNGTQNHTKNIIRLHKFYFMDNHIEYKEGVEIIWKAEHSLFKVEMFPFNIFHCNFYKEINRKP